MKLRAQLSHFMPGIGDPYSLTVDEFFQLAGQIPEIMGLAPKLSLGT